MLILHIYEVRAIFLLFCGHKDTEYESLGMEIVVAGPICNHKNIKGSILQLYPYSKRWEQTIVAFLYNYGARAIIIIFCDHQDT